MGAVENIVFMRSIIEAAPEMTRVQAPLVIGVTGHRDLRPQDLDPLEKKVKHIFTGLRDLFPFTPFLVLSPLAEGADRLVARVALLPEVGARLVSPLPMPKRLYEQDFETPESLDEFHQLLERADSWFELPLVEGEEASIAQQGPARDKRYEQVGLYITRQSQILIALWDGVELNKVGGTSTIVRFQTQGLPRAQECDLQPPELFPVYQIVTPRRSNPKPAGEPFQLKEIYPPAFRHDDLKPEEYYTQVFRNLDEFNRRIAISLEWLKDAVPASKSYLIGNFDEMKLSGGEALTLRRYAVADALAIRFLKQMVRKHWALHAWVFGAFVSFVLFAHLGEFHVWWMFLALALLGIAIFTHKRAKRIALDSQSLDYRAMAEGSRVLFFWLIAGIDDSVSDNYLDKQRTELDWIRNALRGWSIGVKDRWTIAFANVRERLDFVVEHWVNDQLAYFKKKSKQNEDSAELMERAVSLSVTLALLGAVGIAVAAIWNSAFHHDWWESPKSEWLAWPIIAIDLFLALGALLHHFRERMAYSEHAKQYRRMMGVFQNASEMIRAKLDSNDIAGARRCLRNLGREALAENADWVLLHRDRPLELPHP